MRIHRKQRIVTAALAVTFLASAVVGVSIVVVVVIGLAAIGVSLAPSTHQNASQSPDDLIRQTAHELRTPLTSMQVAIDLLADQSIHLDDDERFEMLQLADVEAAHMLHVVDNLTMSTKLAQQSITPKPIHFSLSTVVRRAVQRNQPVAARTIRSEHIETGVLADPKLVTQIVSNLVQNIDRYAPYGRVDIEYEHSGDQIIVSFADSGPGIESALAATVFDGTDSSIGLGIGLKLSRMLARAMGGDLILQQDEAREAMGSVFALSLPAAGPDVVLDALPADLADSREVALSPRARLVIDISSALSEPSLDMLTSRIHAWFSDLLGARGGILLVPRPDGSWDPVGSFGAVKVSGPLVSSDLLDAVMTKQTLSVETDLDDESADWGQRLGAEGAMFLPLLRGGVVIAVLAVGWDAHHAMPKVAGVRVAEALAQLTAFGFQNSSDTANQSVTQALRASVMESLPVAISVFKGNPPRIVDWNQAERDMLGINNDSERPRLITESRSKYQLRYEDGTLVSNRDSHVMRCIATGKQTGPITMHLTRPDGVTVIVSARCYPIRNTYGDVTGGVVLSEILDMVEPNVTKRDDQ